MDAVSKIKAARKIWLSTHKNADGDGLGSEIAFYHAMKIRGQAAQIIHNDQSPSRYFFLTDQTDIRNCEESFDFHPSDLAIIFDTHDPLLCQPLFEKFQNAKIPVLFVDHHVPIKNKISNVTYLINEEACCTGEIVLQLIRELGISLTSKISTALYSSLLFDTQNFKYIRNSSTAFEMAAELLKNGADHLLIQKNLFDNWSVNKMNFLSILIQNVDYRNQQKIALIKINRKSLTDFGLSSDDVSDFVDLFMSIQSLDIAIVIREEKNNDFKLSFRSRTHEVLSWAQSFNGGGHLYSSGAWVSSTEKEILSKIDNLISKS